MSMLGVNWIEYNNDGTKKWNCIANFGGTKIWNSNLLFCRGLWYIVGWAYRILAYMRVCTGWTIFRKSVWKCSPITQHLMSLKSMILRYVLASLVFRGIYSWRELQMLCLLVTCPPIRGVFILQMSTLLLQETCSLSVKNFALNYLE